MYTSWKTEIGYREDPKGKKIEKKEKRNSNLKTNKRKEDRVIET